MLRPTPEPLAGPKASLPEEDPSKTFQLATEMAPDAPGAWRRPGELGAADMVAIARFDRDPGRGRRVPLPEPHSLNAPLDQVLAARRTRRTFGGGTLSLPALSTWLGAGFGVVEPAPGPGQRARRTAPSAGGLYPVQVWVFPNRVEQLGQRFYRYLPDDRCLVEASPPVSARRVQAALCEEPAAAESAVVFVLVLQAERTRRKYGARGYRYALLDAGHVAQNLCLAAAALELPIQPSCGFYDRALSTCLGVDGVEVFPAYVLYGGTGS